MGIEGTKYSVYHSSELEVIECCVCAMNFAVPVTYKENLRKNKTLFYCPMGHTQSYSKSTEQLLKEAHKEETERLKNANRHLYDELEKLKLKCKPGCPYCGKKVKYVEMHIKRMHPEKLPRT
jgi:type 1 glutamine amidotransferase